MGEFDPNLGPRFIHTALFEQEWKALCLNDDDLRVLQRVLRVAPARHPVVRATGGLRKVRHARHGDNRGKSGSCRSGYAYFPLYGTVLLVTVWGKNEKENLSAADAAVIRRVIGEIEALVMEGEI